MKCKMPYPIIYEDMIATTEKSIIRIREEMFKTNGDETKLAPLRAKLNELISNRNKLYELKQMQNN